jgi:hypothetical protein
VHTTQDEPHGRPQHRSGNSSTHVRKDGTTRRTKCEYREGWEETQGVRWTRPHNAQTMYEDKIVGPTTRCHQTSATDSLQEPAQRTDKARPLYLHSLSLSFSSAREGPIVRLLSSDIKGRGPPFKTHKHTSCNMHAPEQYYDQDYTRIWRKPEPV